MNLATPAALAAAIPAVLLAQVFTGLYLPTQLSNAHVGAGTAATAALGAVVMLVGLYPVSSKSNTPAASS